MSGVDAAGRVPGTGPAAQAGAQVTPATPAPVGASPATALASPASDAMLETLLVQSQNVATRDVGLRTGPHANPFATLLQAGVARGAPGARRLVADRVSLEVDLVPPTEAMGKLAGFEKRGFAADTERQGDPRRAAAVREGVMLLTADALPSDDGEPLAEARTVLAAVMSEEAPGPRSAEALGNRMFAHKGSFPQGMDVHAFVQAVLREAYLFQNELLLDKGRRMREITEYRKALRRKKLEAKKLEREVLDGENPDEALEQLKELLGFEIDEDEPGTGGPTDGDPDRPSESDPTETGNDSHRERVAVADFLGGLPTEPVPNPEPRLSAFVTSVEGDRWKTSSYLASALKEMRGEAAAILSHASRLPPSTYVHLVRGLVRGLIRIAGLPGSEKGRDRGFRNENRSMLGTFAGALKTVLSVGTPAQLAQLATHLDSDEWKMIERGPASRGPVGESWRDHIASGAAALRENPFPEGSEVFQLFDLWSAPKRSADELRYTLSMASPKAASAFLEEVADSLPASGPLELESLLGTLPKHALEDSTVFAWLGERLAPVTIDSPSSLVTDESSPNIDATQEPGSDPEPDASHEVPDDEPQRFNRTWSREKKAEYIGEHIQVLENELATTGEDGQMMQLEIQQLLQKQQQFLTMMSNVSKMMHDVAMSIIRKIGG